MRAVDGVDLTLGKGEIVALVGESGSGKTTTGRALVRLAPITGGQVLLEGRDVTSIGGSALRDYRRRVQIIFQDPYESLDPRRSIGDQVAEPLAVHSIGTAAERAERVDQALDDAGLRPPARYRDRFPHELSGGQRQRVAIACAMALGPDVLVADEPVSMLDVSLRSGILRVMLDLRERRGIGILFITHDLSLAWLIADRIAVMYLGRVMEIGPADELVRDPRHPYTRALLSVMPSPDPAHRRQRQILRGETPDASRVPPGCRFHTRCPLAFDRCRVEEPPSRRGRAWSCRGLLPGRPASTAGRLTSLPDLAPRRCRDPGTDICACGATSDAHAGCHVTVDHAADGRPTRRNEDRLMRSIHRAVTLTATLVLLTGGGAAAASPSPVASASGDPAGRPDLGPRARTSTPTAGTPGTDSPATIRFDAEVSGSTGCNDFHGPWSFDGTHLAIGPLTYTSPGLHRHQCGPGHGRSGRRSARSRGTRSPTAPMLELLDASATSGWATGP